MSFMRAPRTTWKDRLRPFAQHIEQISALIRVMEDEELKKLGIACRNPTSTNCGWATYQAAKVIMGEVDAELRRRQRPDYRKRTESSADDRQ
jgi:hypothetical protein